MTKYESEMQRADAEFKKMVAKIAEELSQKDAKIRQFEKNEKKNMVEKEKITNLEAKVKLLNESLKSIQTDRDFVLQEKKILEESIGVKERKLVELEQKLPDYK